MVDNSNDSSIAVNESGSGIDNSSQSNTVVGAGAGSQTRGLRGASGAVSSQRGVTQAIADNTAELDRLIVRLNTELTALNNAQIAAESLQIDQSGKMFFDYKVRPFVDSMYFLALSSSSVAATAQIFSNNVLSKKRELRHALDLSYSINREIECVFQTLRKRMKEYRCGVEKEIGCCNGRCRDCNIYKEYDE